MLKCLPVQEILRQAQQVGLMSAYHNYLVTSLVSEISAYHNYLVSVISAYHNYLVSVISRHQPGEMKYLPTTTTW
jgi:hypothetical protein